MLRQALLGSLVFGALAALAGLVWTAFEFPFAIVLPAAVGWYAVVRPHFGARRALFAGAVGGVTFTAVLMFGMFLAITDGAPVAITGWLAAMLAAVVAGALTGEVIGGVRASLPVAAFSAIGMLLATFAAAVFRDIAPDAAQTEGLVQYGYFAVSQGVIGAFVGAAAGAGVFWVARNVRARGASDAGAAPGTPRPA